MDISVLRYDSVVHWSVPQLRHDQKLTRSIWVDKPRSQALRKIMEFKLEGDQGGELYWGGHICMNPSTWYAYHDSIMLVSVVLSHCKTQISNKGCRMEDFHTHSMGDLSFLFKNWLSLVQLNPSLCVQKLQFCFRCSEKFCTVSVRQRNGRGQA